MAESDVKALKKVLRKELLARRDALTDAEQERARVLITERIIGHQWFYLSNVILGFVSYGSEICTLEILEEALKKGKKVYVPKIEQDGQTCEGTMEFYRIWSLAELKEGYKGIWEPDGSSEKYVYNADAAKKTLILLPGVGFDSYRNRMGYGKGFYDRFLANKEELQIRSIGIGHVCQRVDEIPMDENDI
ncbi:MAG: 5-formyltetrahydrofolate cyclo-ligase, partial [Acetatifactor sp.]|nr:5-formyltetrahydrofolate cyclo-ligase [Acetatifactor sp.]